MLPVDTPKLPKWPFLLSDAVLLGLAWLIGDQSRTPFAGAPLIAMVICVVCGAIIAAIPFLTDYARRQDEALDERQRSLESISRTVTASAEQISIAAGGLHEIAALAQRNLQAAEQLPVKLQEKIAGLKSPPDSSRDAERDELKKELARLRASESERLQSAVNQITQAAAELSKLARPEPGSTEPSRSVERAPAEALLEPSAEILPLPAAAGTDSPPPLPKRIRKSKPEAPAPVPEASDSGNPKSEIEIPKSDEPAPIPAATILEVVPVAPGSTPPIETNAADASAPAPAISEAPLPKPERKRAPRKPKPEPAATEVSGSENRKSEIVTLKSADSALDRAHPPASPEPAERVAPAAETVEPLRPEPDATASSRKVEPTRPEPGYTEPVRSAERASPEPVERAVSSDGATRLLVTAYIGIGNRLFIRGAGPGLSWDKGLPLQFVSIGKWRWETSDATAPVQFKLYKNDDSECTALGPQTLDPGQQQEVTATF